MAGGAKWRLTIFESLLIDGEGLNRHHVESDFSEVLAHKAHALLERLSGWGSEVLTWKELAVRQISPALPSGVALRGQLPGQTSMFEEAMAGMEEEETGVVFNFALNNEDGIIR